jgi:DNA-binding MarR family transcriptional regulator
MSELADALDMDRTTLTRNLKPLLESSWVEVRAHGSDARMRAVYLTAAGEKQMQLARAHWRRAQNEVNQTIGEGRIGELHALIDAYLPLFRPIEEEDA